MAFAQAGAEAGRKAGRKTGKGEEEMTCRKGSLGQVCVQFIREMMPNNILKMFFQTFLYFLSHFLRICILLDSKILIYVLILLINVLFLFLI